MPTKYNRISINCIKVMKQTLSTLLSSLKGDNLTRKQGEATKFAMTTHLNILENRPFRYRENLQNKKTADLVLLILFMKTNG